MGLILPFANFTDQVINIIDEEGLLQAGVARKAGLHPDFLSRVLSGKNKMTSKTEEKLRQALKLYLPPE